MLKNNYFTSFIFLEVLTFLVCGAKIVKLYLKIVKSTSRRSRLKKNQEPEPLGKKIRIRSRKKINGSPARNS